MKHLITSVAPGGIADEMEIRAGDFLLSVNGKEVKDVLDYGYLTRDENILLEIEKADVQPGNDSSPEIWELEIEKDEDEDLGLAFESPLMDKPRQCRNKCVFCFIDQMPPGMRDTLYFKDDDPRLSFLSGNYVTLTNVTRAEAERIAFYHLSPLRISVHALEPALRAKMLANPNAANISELLDIFKSAGITMHFQVVLCHGINDGEHLDYTIRGLFNLGECAASLSVVPVGLTRHREGLCALPPFTPGSAAEVIRQVEGWQAYCAKERGTSFVYCADEFYLKAGLPMPACESYEGFPQLENGVGMTALFTREFNEAREKDAPQKGSPVKTAVVTGVAAAGFMRALTEPLGNILIYEVENKFFGPLITVSGLLTGGDVMAHARESVVADGAARVFIPQNAFRSGTETMLDGVTRAELAAALGVPVIIGSADGGKLYGQLAT